MAIGNPITLTNNVASKIISATATADQTLFTVTGGYRINQLAVFRNGVRLTSGSDFTANDGTSVTLLTAANLNDTLEFQVFDDFRVAGAIQADVSTQTINGELNATGGFNIGIQSGGTDIATGVITAINFIGTGNTAVYDSASKTVDISIAGSPGAAGTWANYDTNTGVSTTKKVKIENDLEVTGVTTSTGGFVGNVTGNASGTAGGLTGTPDITINNLTGVAATFTGVLTYEDVTNVDSVGLVTARTGVRITDGGLIVTAGIATLGAGLTMGDNDKAFFGDGGELQIFSNGTNPSIDAISGDLLIRNLGTTGDIYIDAKSGERGIKIIQDGAVELYYDNSKKFETAGTGVTVTGTLDATGGVQVGSGQSFGDNGGTAVYYGDGSNLTGIAVGLNTEAGTASGIVTHVRLSSAQDHKITATGITTITSSGSGTEGESHTIRIVNSGIATVGFSTYFLFPSGAAPSLPTADGAISLISFTVHDSVGAGCTQLLAGASVNYS